MALTQINSNSIADGSIQNADISSSASIDASKITGLSTDSITNGTSNVSVAASGDITVTRAGTTVGEFLSTGIHVNDSIKFTAGTGQDLQIYHTGTNSYVADSGTGVLALKSDGAGVHLLNGAETEYLARFNVDSGCFLYHDNALKLETTSSGINVTGSVTCDGLTTDGVATLATTSGQVIVKDTDSSGTAAQSNIRFHDSASTQLGVMGYIGTADSNFKLVNSQNAEIRLGTNGSDRLALAADGSVFYPVTNNATDIGASNLQFRNAYFDGIVNCDGVTSEGDVNIRSGTGGLILRDNNSSGNAATPYILLEDSTGADKVEIGLMSTGNQDVTIRNKVSAAIIFATNNTDRCFVDATGHFIPSSDQTYDLGTSSNRWRNVYTNDLNLSNEGHSNDVDGTWGSWTIQEGEDDLFLLNRRNGKKYKFNLTEVS